MSEEDDPFTLVINRVPPRGSRGGDGREGEAVAPGEAYATITGGRQAPAVEFIRQGDHSFTVPYGYDPLLWWMPPKTLIIEYPGLFSVVLRGRQLGELHRRLRDRRVIWIRQCEPGHAGEMPVAVTSIEIIQSFPSRTGWTGEPEGG